MHQGPSCAIHEVRIQTHFLIGFRKRASVPSQKNSSLTVRASLPKLRKAEAERRWGRGTWQAKEKPVSWHFFLSLRPPLDVNSMTCGATRDRTHGHRSEWTSKERCSQPQPECTWVWIIGLPLREAAVHTCFICLQPSTSALLPEGRLPALHAHSGELEPPPPLT